MVSAAAPDEKVHGTRARIALGNDWCRLFFLAIRLRSSPALFWYRHGSPATTGVNSGDKVIFVLPENTARSSTRTPTTYRLWVKVFAGRRRPWPESFLAYGSSTWLRTLSRRRYWPRQLRRPFTTFLLSQVVLRRIVRHAFRANRPIIVGRGLWLNLVMARTIDRPSGQMASRSPRPGRNRPQGGAAADWFPLPLRLSPCPHRCLVAVGDLVFVFGLSNTR